MPNAVSESREDILVITDVSRSRTEKIIPNYTELLLGPRSRMEKREGGEFSSMGLGETGSKGPSKINPSNSDSYVRPVSTDRA